VLVPVGKRRPGVPELTQLQEPGIRTPTRSCAATHSRRSPSGTALRASFPADAGGVVPRESTSVCGEQHEPLARGKIVRIPDKDAAAAVATADARRIVSAQYADFNEYRRSLRNRRSRRPPRLRGPSGIRSGQCTQGKKSGAVSKEPPKDELRLFAAQTTPSAAQGGGRRSGDDMAAKNNALKEANERIALWKESAGHAEAGADQESDRNPIAAAKPRRQRPPRPRTAPPQRRKRPRPRASQSAPQSARGGETP